MVLLLLRTSLNNSVNIDFIMNRIIQFFILLFFAGLFSCDSKKLPPGDLDQGGLIVPDGFDVVVVADSTGAARHML